MESPQVPQRVGNEDETKNILTTGSGDREQGKIRGQRAESTPRPRPTRVPFLNIISSKLQSKEKISYQQITT